MWYVFGFAEHAPEDLPHGVIGVPRALPLDGFDAVVIAALLAPDATSWDEADPDVLAAAAIHHDQVLTAAIGCNPLPARFGTSVPSEEDARGLGRLHGSALVDAFEQSRGRAEFDVRVRVARVRERGSGRDYLARRRDQLAGTDQIGHVATLIESSTTATQVRERSSENVRFAVLAAPHEIRAVRETLAERDDVAVEVRGPYAPYSFVQAPDGADRVDA